MILYISLYVLPIGMDRGGNGAESLGLVMTRLAAPLLTYLNSYQMLDLHLRVQRLSHGNSLQASDRMVYRPGIEVRAILIVTHVSSIFCFEGASRPQR